jgi:YidC/Oxa1 family membrane protein insertase
VERRNVTLFISLALVWLSWIGLQLYFADKKPAQAEKPDDDAVAQTDEKGGDQDNLAKLDKAKTDEQLEKDARIAAPENKDAPAVVAEREAKESDIAREWLALGSADPASGFAAVYYFDNRGATVECVELNGYRSVEDSGGYLGRLNLTTAPAGGAKVQVVGAGTPAALAKSSAAAGLGLAVGDIIQTIDEQPIQDAVAVTEYLRDKTRPGQTITIGLSRGGAPLQFTASLIRPPLAVVQPESHTYKLPNGGMQILPQDPLSLRLTLDTIGSRALKADQDELAGLPSLYNNTWKTEAQGPDFIEFSYLLDAEALAAAKIEKAGPLKVTKRYKIANSTQPGESAFHLTLQVRIQNQGEQAAALAYRLNGPTGLPLEGWWYSTKLSPKMWAAAGARDIVWDQPGHNHKLLGCPQIVSDTRQAIKDKKPPQFQLIVGDRASPLEYAGVDTQFFASAVLPQALPDGQKILFRSAFAKAVQDVTWIPKTRIRTANVSFSLTTTPTSIEPGGELSHDYRVFFGPKDPRVLAPYELDPLIEYGWPIFAAPAKLLRSVLTGLYGFTWLIGLANYGIAIILLTVIVRTCMIPISLKQARSAAKMQELAPEIQKIKDKFPDDPMKQHTAVQELYKKHDFNMFAGCLPVFIQLPIFIGLYRCLSVDIDLRDAALFPGFDWASNLAGPDKLFRWDSWMPAFFSDEADGWLGPFFSVFPLITVALFLVQQKMLTPPATDEQTKMQQQMMTYMTVFMGVMFYKVPAGLCIYFITSSLWGIAERKLLPKSQLKKPDSGPDSGGGGGGLLARLTTKPTSPNGSSKPNKRPKQRR